MTSMCSLIACPRGLYALLQRIHHYTRTRANCLLSGDPIVLNVDTKLAYLKHLFLYSPFFGNKQLPIAYPKLEFSEEKNSKLVVKSIAYLRSQGYTMTDFKSTKIPKLGKNVMPYNKKKKHFHNTLRARTHFPQKYNIGSHIRIHQKTFTASYSTFKIG